MAQIQKPKRNRKKWPRIVAGILVLLLLVTGTGFVLLDHFMPSQTIIPQSIVHIPEETVSWIVRPFQTAFSWAANQVTNYMQSWKLWRTIGSEYNKLMDQLDQLTYESLFSKSLEEENKQLRILLGEHEAQAALDPVLATVTAKESGNWFSIFTIDKGEVHGLKTDMAVINVDGLIGRVYEVQSHSAQVITIIDARSSIGALIESSSDQGIVKGALGVEEDATCRMYYLPVNLVPRPGDSVVTSGVGLPKGLKIGVVRESTRHMDENKHYIVIEPYVDFMHIQEVLVLRYITEDEALTMADDGQLDYIPSQLDTPRPVPVIGQDTLDNVSATLTPVPRPSRGPSETPGPNDPADPNDDPDDLDFLYPDDYIPTDATPTPDPDLAPESDEE